jgi:Uma2 family endonuclease
MSCAAAGWAPPPTSPPPARPVDHPLYFQATIAWQALGRTASQREHWSAGEAHLCLFDPQDGTLVELTIDDHADSVAVRWVFVDPTGSRAPSQGSGGSEQALQACRAYASDGSPDPQQPLTAERFFALADAALELGLRLELIDGRVVAMAGASLPHNAIVASVITALSQALAHTDCVVMASDVYTAVAKETSFTLPDVLILCDPPNMSADRGRTHWLTNPSVVLEVISPESRTRDLTVKPGRFLALQSVEAYLTLRSDEREVLIWRRGSATPETVTTGSIQIHDVIVPIATLYAGLDKLNRLNATRPQ